MSKDFWNIFLLDATELFHHIPDEISLIPTW
jgi:hypothetical protein